MDIVFNQIIHSYEYGKLVPITGTTPKTITKHLYGIFVIKIPTVGTLAQNVSTRLVFIELRKKACESVISLSKLATYFTAIKVEPVLFNDSIAQKLNLESYNYLQQYASLGIEYIDACSKLVHYCRHYN